jgi:hypothetical protein
MYRGLRAYLLICLFTASVVPCHGQPGEPTNPRAGQEVSEPIPFLISLFPRTGRPNDEDRTRRTRLELHLRKHLSPVLKGTPYGSVKVDVPANWEQVTANLRRGRSMVIECDPVLYFSALSSREDSHARYQVVLQEMRTDLPRGQLLILKGSAVERAEDLQGRRVGFVHRIAGGGAQIQRALNAFDLSPNRDYQVWNAGFVENAFLCLERNLKVDAIAVPSDLAREYLKERSFPPVEILLSTDEYLPPLFAMRREDLESRPTLANSVVEGLRSFFGSENLVAAKDDVYETTRRESLPWEGFWEGL